MPKDSNGHLVAGRVSPTRFVPRQIVRPEYVGKPGPSRFTGSDIYGAEAVGRIRESGRIAADAIAVVGASIRAGITTDSLQAWQHHRGEFGTFVRADVADVAGSAGPPNAGWPGAALVAPTLVLTDGGRQLALNGTPCGFDGEGPRGTARILIQEGLLTVLVALTAITSRHQVTAHRTAAAP